MFEDGSSGEIEIFRKYTGFQNRVSFIILLRILVNAFAKITPSEFYGICVYGQKSISKSEDNALAGK
ncbi:hypothetical protein [Thermoplasma acidophilum]|uniref:hypothetical protein n=1 Tax=Thermoplasma acidophilum TaxID=2303 RepID=UPI00064EB88D|nr:hypothetical protein [Thermoplasma acidophilum]MCY0851589.1 hypothetical protein [Thermoplasma acidophilum]